MLLEARPLRPFSRTHTVHGFRGELARVSLDVLAEGSEFLLDGEPHRVRPGRGGSGAYVLEGPDGVLAEARRPTRRSPHEVIYGRHRLTVAPATGTGHVHVVREGVAARGRIRRRLSPFGRGFEAELAPELPLPVQIFITWLVMSGAQPP
jgi:hypothetical protein